MTDEIVRYEKNVFTNDGQTDVDGFTPKLEKVKELIKNAGAITVYYGFHGNTDGEFDRKFDAEELQKSLGIARAFPGATMVQVDGPDDSKIAYDKHNENGQVLFTWCDSDTYIKTRKLLPAIVR
ncbi:hypothetical protein OH720_14135 [Pseudomonas sp. WJP1]|uniref:hypothetical protein n=1 Tax=Pseudomonas sp. WJP1 TaxID=2986947 RepID=UPI00234AAF38|nr:hypothetical protein [Pseudomonas sp. WJP1]WCM54090.1 hypothetical protein OH720_14135 [Pseudomonas sp. WJP1]